MQPLQRPAPLPSALFAPLSLSTPLENLTMRQSRPGYGCASEAVSYTACEAAGSLKHGMEKTLP